MINKITNSLSIVIIFLSAWSASLAKADHYDPIESRIHHLESMVSDLQQRVQFLEQSLNQGGTRRAICTLTTARNTYRGIGFDTNMAAADARNQCVRFEPPFICDSGALHCQF